jgi:hypothetical protein
MSLDYVNCPTCGISFYKRANLNRHIQKFHPVHQMSERGRTEEREEVSGFRKKSKSRSRSRSAYGDGSDDEFGEEVSEAQQFFNATYPRLVKAKDPVKIFEGADDEVQTLLTEKYFKERAKFLREKQEFETKEAEFQKLEDVFQKILLRPQTTTTTTAVTSNSAGGIFGLFNSQNFTTNTSANP